jgi:ATP-dependent DNA helicase RecG
MSYFAMMFRSFCLLRRNMYSKNDLENLLEELNSVTVDDLEDQYLDFKQWPNSIKHALKLSADMAVCMANGGGGSVVFGVVDKVIGRESALIGVPLDVDINTIKRHIYDSTDPKLTPDFDELYIPEGTGRLLIMNVPSGLRPYTDTSGMAKVRIGKECKPLTGSLRKDIFVATGDSDGTGELVRGSIESLVSPLALEKLKQVSLRENAPSELLSLDNDDFLSKLKVIKSGKLNVAGLLLAGKEEALREKLPLYRWSYLKMKTDTDYEDKIDGFDSITVALDKIEERISANNPIITIKQPLYHLEYRTYPIIAIREALLNAFCHADYTIASPIMVKQYPDRLEFSNPGGFIGGISPKNILNHDPVSRNPALVNAMTTLRLVNRSNLGIGRMFKAMLSEGKEPPLIEELGQTVQVTFLAQEISESFLAFFNDEAQEGRPLSTEVLLILRYLLRHREIDLFTASEISQRPISLVGEILSRMVRFTYLDRCGSGKQVYWTLSSSCHTKIKAPGDLERDSRIDWEAAKTRILTILKSRSDKSGEGLRNSEIRQITHYDRFQVYRLMQELIGENKGKILLIDPKKHRKSRYIYIDNEEV